MLFGERGRVLAGSFPKHQEVGQGVAAEPVGAVEPGGRLAGGKEAGHGRHLRIAVDLDAAHDVVGRRADFHRFFGDVDVRQLFELVVHAGEFLLDPLRGARELFLDPLDVEEHTAVGTAPAGLDLAHDAAGHVVAGQQFRRAPGVLVAHDVAPALFGRVGGLGFVVVGDVVEHEALALAIEQDAAFASDPFGDQDPFHAGRPYHPGRVELDELHVHQRGTDLIGQRLPVARVLPAVAGDRVGPAHPAGGQHDGFGPEEPELPVLAVVRQGPADPPGLLEEGDDRHLHVDVDPLVDPVVLEGADHLEAGPVADVGQSGIPVAAEIPLEDLAVFGPVEDGAPGLKFPGPLGRFLGVELGHPPVVEVLAAAQGVGEMDHPVVAIVHVPHRGRHPALGHDRVGLAEEGFADQADGDAAARRLDRGSKARAAGSDDQDVVIERLDVGH